MEKERKTLGIAFLVILAVMVGVSLIGLWTLQDEPVVLQGQIECTEIRISGKLPGRIDSFRVKEGQWVQRGDTLVVINSPEARAKYRQVQAWEAVAQSQDQKIDAGTRLQLVRAAEALWNKAKSDLQLARVTNQRIAALYRDSVVSSQRRDEVEAVYQAALSAERAAHQQYLLAEEGARKEDKASAHSVVEAARGTVDEVQALLADAWLTAPESGEIGTIYPKRGELVGAGMPLMNLLVLDDCHLVLQVREDYLSRFRMGGCFPVHIPALEGGSASSSLSSSVVSSASSGDVSLVSSGDSSESSSVGLEDGSGWWFRITYISPLGSFATWRSTKQLGSYDRKTFEIHAVPVRPLSGLRPGMSVLVNLEQVDACQGREGL